MTNQTIAFESNDHRERTVLTVPRYWTSAAAGRSGQSGITRLLPSEYMPLTQWIETLRGHTTILLAANRRRQQQSQGLTQYFAVSRMFAGFATLISEYAARMEITRRPALAWPPIRTSGHLIPISASVKRELARRAEGLQEALNEKKTQFLDPVRHFYPGTVRAQEGAADLVLSDLAQNENARLLARLASDDNVGTNTIDMVCRIAVMQVVEAVLGVAESPRHETVATRCGRAMTSADGKIQELVAQHPNVRSRNRQERIDAARGITFEATDLYETPVAIFNIIGGAFGNTPIGTDSPMQAYARALITARVFGSNTFRGSSGLAALDGHLDVYLRTIGEMGSGERDAIVAAVKSGDEASVERAHSVLDAHFQTGFYMNLAATTMCAFQFAYIVAQEVENEDGEGLTGRDVIDGAFALAQTGAGVIYTIARLRAGGTTVAAVPQSALIGSARRMQRVIEAADPALSGGLAVLSIIDGAMLIAQGHDEQNALTQTVGVLTIGAGTCSALALIAANAGWVTAGATLGPIGVALGMAAAAVAIGQAFYIAGQPRTVRAVESIWSFIAGSNHYDLRSLHNINQRLGQLYQYIDEQYGDDYDLMAGAVDLGGNALARLPRKLSALGFNEEQVNILAPGAIERF